jgi:hypothetical protein
MDSPTQEDVRHALASFDERLQKIVAGMLAVMIKEPSRVREKEWIVERLAEVTVMAGEFAADNPQDGVRVVQAFLEAHAEELLRACFLLFQRVGLDLAPRAAAGFTFDEALRCGLEYLPSLKGAQEVAGRTPQAEARVERDLGEQPIALLMAEHGLKPSDLVTASDEQLTHKMVTRAMKGRRLTANTMGKVQRAWDKVTAGAEPQSGLFNYET